MSNTGKTFTVSDAFNPKKEIDIDKEMNSNPLYKKIEEFLGVNVFDLMTIDTFELTPSKYIFDDPEFLNYHDQRFAVMCDVMSDDELYDRDHANNIEEYTSLCNRIFFHYLKGNEFIRIYHGNAAPDTSKYITISKRNPLGNIFEAHLELMRKQIEVKNLSEEIHKTTDFHNYITQRDIEFSE